MILWRIVDTRPDWSQPQACGRCVHFTASFCVTAFCRWLRFARMSVARSGVQALSLQRRLRNAAATVALSAAVLLGATQPTFAATTTPDPPTQQEASAVPQATPVFLPNVSPLVPDELKSKGADTLTDEYLTSDERATVALFERNTPSVVNITNLAEVQRKCAPTARCKNQHQCKIALHSRVTNSRCAAPRICV